MNFNWLKSHYTSIALLGVMALLILCVFFQGRNLGHHHVIGNSHHDNIWSMGVAISDDIYHLKAGYLYYPEVCTALFQSGLTHPLDSVGYPKNLQDKKLINDALDKAAHLSFNTQRKSVSAGRSTPIPCADLGLVDYYKIAFRLFGLRISAPYNFYFVLLVLVLACFAMNFWNSPAYLLVPVVYLVSLLCLLPSLADEVCYSTLANMRHLPVLALLPTLHILLLFLRGKIQNKWSLACLIFQSIVLSFLITVRVSAEWTILALVMACGVYGLRNFKRGSFKSSVQDNRAIVACMVLLALTYLAISSYKIICLPILFGLARYQPSVSLAEFAFGAIFCMLVASAGCFLFFKIKEKRKLIFKCIMLLSCACAVSMLWLIFKERNDLNWFTTYCDGIIKWGVRFTIAYMLYLALNLVLVKWNKSYSMLWSDIVHHRYASMMVCFMIFLCYKICFLSQLHPIYFSSEVLPCHPRYHNAYIGLESSSHFPPYSPGGVGDNLAFNAGLNFFLEKHAAKGFSREDYVSRVTGHYRFGLHDQTIREVYIKFICQHPFIFLDAHWHKLKGLVGFNVQFLREHMRPLLWAFLFCLPFTALDQYWQSAFTMKHLLYACLLMIIGSSIPYLYAYPSHLCADQSVIVALVCVITAAYSLTAMILKSLSLYRLKSSKAHD